MHGLCQLRYAPDSIGGGGSGASGGFGSMGGGIRHFGSGAAGSRGVGNGAEDGEAKPKIRTFEQALSVAHSEEHWKRKPTVTGTGATHVRSFHCKLTGDCLENLDRQINEWLDSHPEFEVKFVTSAVGDWTGKLKEPNLIVQVWV